MKTPLLIAGSLRLLGRFRLRSTLILLSALLSVAVVISAINYAAEGRMKVLNRLAELGTNVVTVTPEPTRNVGGRAKTGTIATTLVAADYAEIRRDLPEIEASSATTTASFLVKAGDSSKSGCVVVGTEPAYARIRHWETSEGDFLDMAEMRKSARVAVLGATVRKDLFAEESVVGRRIFINRVPFEVIGVLRERGQGLDATNEDNQIYIPLTTAMRRLANVDYFSSIVFEVRRWEEIDSTAAKMREILRVRHRALSTRPDDFQIQNQKTLVDTQLAATSRLDFLVRSIGMSGLVVAGLGILAICWIAVGERVVEIGLRRALGATRVDIFSQFFFEAALISGLGCAAGLVAAWESTGAIARRADLPVCFDGKSAALVVAFALLMNLVFALIPSRRAARWDPIRALKSE